MTMRDMQWEKDYQRNLGISQPEVPILDETNSIRVASYQINNKTGRWETTYHIPKREELQSQLVYILSERLKQRREYE